MGATDVGWEQDKQATRTTGLAYSLIKWTDASQERVVLKAGLVSHGREMPVVSHPCFEQGRGIWLSSLRVFLTSQHCRNGRERDCQSPWQDGAEWVSKPHQAFSRAEPLNFWFITSPLLWCLFTKSSSPAIWFHTWVSYKEGADHRDFQCFWSLWRGWLTAN